MLSLGQRLGGGECLCGGSEQVSSCLHGLWDWGKQLFHVRSCPEDKGSPGTQWQAQGRGEVKDTLAPSWALVLNKS